MPKRCLVVVAPWNCELLENPSCNSTAIAMTVKRLMGQPMCQ